MTQTTLRDTHHRPQVPGRRHSSFAQNLPSTARNHHIATPNPRQPNHTLTPSLKSRNTHTQSLDYTNRLHDNIRSPSAGKARNRHRGCRESDYNRLNRNLRPQTAPLPHRHTPTPALLLRHRRHVRRAHNPPPHRSRARRFNARAKSSRDAELAVPRQRPRNRTPACESVSESSREHAGCSHQDDGDLSEEDGSV